MVYIDPKDQPANPEWPLAYMSAWEARRELRLKIAEAGMEITKLEHFLEVYEKMAGKPKGNPGWQQGASGTVLTTAGAR